MPTNLYGPGDKFDPRSGHVLPALIAKAHAAKQTGASEFVVWGSGTPLREFMYVDDLADALVFLLKSYSDDEHVNIGVGSEMTIRQLAEMVMRVVGFDGQLKFDSSKPDGTPRKLLDSSRLLAMGWMPKISIEAGLAMTYRWYVNHFGGSGAIHI
jgi:GDP-L-fucose synthase